MKLILTHEVSNLGAPGDIVEVRGGYARNYLLPRNYAIAWSKGAAKQVESIKAARESRAVHDLETAQGIKATLEAQSINVQVNAGAGGRLFGAVTVSDIASAMEEAGAPVDKRRIEVGNPIKSLGTHQVTVRVHPEVAATATLNIIPVK